MPDPDRFRTARSTLLADRFMTSFIKVGGLVIIAAVFAIFIFILVEILPLFRQARIVPAGERQGPAAVAVAFGVDEWGELPFVLTPDGRLHLLPATGTEQVAELPLQPGETATAAVYEQKAGSLILGTSAGRVLVVDLHYANHPASPGQTAQIRAKPEVGATFAIGAPGVAIRAIGLGGTDSAHLVAVL